MMNEQSEFNGFFGNCLSPLELQIESERKKQNDIADRIFQCEKILESYCKQYAISNQRLNNLLARYQLEANANKALLKPRELPTQNNGVSID